MKNKGLKKKPKQAGKKFIATAEHRLTVQVMAGAGMREDQMVLVLINKETGKPIDLKTLRKHFRTELDAGHSKADSLVAQGLFKNATTATPTYPGGIPVAQIFWLKTRMRWKPPPTHEPPNAPPPVAPTAEEADAQEVAKRMAFLLAAGAAEMTEKKKKVKEPA